MCPLRRPPGARFPDGRAHGAALLHQFRLADLYPARAVRHAKASRKPGRHNKPRPHGGFAPKLRLLDVTDYAVLQPLPRSLPLPGRP